MTHQENNRVPLDSIAGITGSLQILELKQLADMEDGYKRQCLQAIKAYKAWRRRHAGETDVIEMLYGNLEGVMLRRHAEDCIHIYWTLRRDFRRGFQDYLQHNKCYPPTKREAKRKITVKAA